jgi:hypothetical protein
MKVIVAIRQAETRRVDAEGPDCEAAHAAADAEVPEGWETLAYRVEGS